MTEGYHRIDTSAEIWTAIRDHHASDLKVFVSSSAPDGDALGDPNQAVLFTEYGLDGARYPLMGAESTWDISREDPGMRINVQHRYWLCVVTGDES